VERKSFAEMDCSVAQSLEVIGEWWSMLIVRDAFFGVTRFEDFHRRLGISRNILRDRLTALVAHGVFVRVPYSEHPPRADYRLTDKGRDLWPVVTALRQWGDRWAAPRGAPVEMVHRACAHVSRAVMVCDHCGDVLRARDVEVVPGEGRASVVASP
jgi:DNA-binding HxlR family transcriptional regulator